MTRTELLTELRALEQLFDNAMVITRIVVAPDGSELRRIPRVVFTPPQKKGTKR
jgi:hypothetical protein